MIEENGRLVCENCHRPASEHCRVHVFPCCPGKCTMDKITFRSLGGREIMRPPNGNDVARSEAIVGRRVDVNPEKPKKPWPKSYLKLPLRYRRIINNFMGTRAPDGDKADKVTNWDKYEQNKANWALDGRLYSFPTLMTDYHTVRKHYLTCGPITEEVNPFRLDEVRANENGTLFVDMPPEKFERE